MTDTMDKLGVYLSLGSNIGDREKYLRAAISRLEEYFLCEAVVSSFLETEPWGFECENNFINCVVRFDIPSAGQNPYLHCHRILSVCKEIESSLGREQNVEYDSQGKRVYHSRPIDIDIIFYGNEEIDLPDLKVPHPLAGERDFVLIPLAEVAKEGIKDRFPRIFSSK